MVYPEITAVILAGGQSSRLGFDKARYKLGGTVTLLEIAVEQVRELSSDVVVVSDAVIKIDGVRYVEDVVPDGGTLCGLYSGLMAARFPYSLVVACDMPFLNPGLLRYMAEQPRNFDVLVPRLGEKSFGVELQPLHAVYAKNCLLSIKEVLDSGSRTIRDIYPMVKTVYLEQEEIACYDPEGRSFFNINTPQDLALAESLVKQGNRYKTYAAGGIISSD